MKVNVEIDLNDFIERWGDDTFETVLKDDIKNEVMKAVKSSPEYRELIKKQTDELLAKLEL
jgi:hypothetical protein